MVRDDRRTDDANGTTPPGPGLLRRAAEAIRALLTDPPHDPDTPPIGHSGHGLEWT